MKTLPIIELLESQKEKLNKDLDFQKRRIEDLNNDLKNSIQNKESIENLLEAIEISIKKLKE